MARDLAAARALLEGLPAEFKRRDGTVYKPWEVDIDEPGTDAVVVSLGTSITWGQGLFYEDKHVTHVCRAVHAAGFVPVLAHYAQSGAVLWPAPASKGGLENNVVRSFSSLGQVPHAAAATRRTQWSDGEFPSASPHIWEQARAAATDLTAKKRNADLVLLDLGANDIEFMAAVLGKDPNNGEASQYVFHCCNHLFHSAAHLVRALRANPRFKDAPIVWLGYHRCITDATRYDAFHAHPLAQLLLHFVKIFSLVFTPSVLKGFQHNVDAFVNLTNGLAHDVLGTVNDPLLVFAESGLQRDNAVFAAESGSWPNAQMPWDDLYTPRTAAAAGDVATVAMAQFNAFFHPNRLGSRLNAASIVAALKELRATPQGAHIRI